MWSERRLHSWSERRLHSWSCPADPGRILQYEWLRFLPEDKDITDPFFKPLVPALYSKLEKKKCLVSASGAWE